MRPAKNVKLISRRISGTPDGYRERPANLEEPPHQASQESGENQRGKIGLIDVNTPIGSIGQVRDPCETEQTYHMDGCLRRMHISIALQID